MKLPSIIQGMLLLAIVSLVVRADPLPPEESMNSTGAVSFPAPTLNLVNPKLRADGPFEFQVNSTQQFKVWIESSTDLRDWTGEGLREPNSAIVLTNRNGPGSHRFYRASDFTLRVQGTVRDIETDLPVPEAKVTIIDAVTQTDAQGVFRALLYREFPLRKITVEKTGYDVLTTQPAVDRTNPNFQISLWLAAPGYRPPNDDFQNRFNLVGTNITVHARTFAATSEPGHELSISFDDYGVFYRRNLWWTWTAPMDGAAMIQRDFRSGVVVYTGQTLQELVSVWDTSNPENGFFVKRGVQYHICFGTESPADSAFTLKMVAPEPPFGVGAWVGDLLVTGSPIRAVGEAFSLSVQANGTSPLKYQWRKDGLNIPDATNTFFFKSDLQLEDAGTYSVLVTNEAGTGMSEDIQITVLSE